MPEGRDRAQMGDMPVFRRGISSVTMGGILLLALTVPGAMAGTKATFTYEVYFAEAFTSSGQDSVDVVAQVGKQDGVPFSSLSVNNWTFQSTCRHGGTVGTISVNTFADSANALITFDKDQLGTVTASGTLAANDTIVNSCTGVETPGPTYSLSVSLQLHATSPLTSTNTRTVTQVPGGVDVQTNKWDQRDAAGSISIGGTTYASDPTTIVHQRFQDVFTPTK